MHWADVITGFVSTHEASIILVSSALILCLIIVSLYLLARLRRLSRSGKPLAAAEGAQRVGDNGDLTSRFDRVEEHAVLLEERGRVLDEHVGGCIQRFGLVRFNAFPDVGGEQSFAFALLDAADNGLVVSGIYSRVDCRVYAKEIAAGQSQHALSDEEREALKRAGAHK